MKKLIFLSLAALLAVLVLTHPGQSQTKSYYSGDAISFNNQLYVGSANTNSLEIFKLSGKTLQSIAKVKPYNERFNNYGDFYDVKFVVSGGHLFVYAISDFSLYKYELSTDDRLTFITSQKNTYWEWYNRVDEFDGNLVTISSKGVKIWNSDLQVIDAYTLEDITTPYNVRANNGRFILNVQDNHLTILDRENRTQVANIPLNYKNNPGNHQSYQDAAGQVYVVDDYYAKKFSLDGRLLASFKHLDYEAYDVAASGYNDYIYFSNGIGVVKLKQADMSLVDYQYTNTLGGARGWAMGLEAVYANGEKVVIFNNSNILVLDDKLNKIASVAATEESDPAAVENLFLNINHNFGSAGAVINLNGGGYFPQENLTITFGGVKTTAQADNRGRFTTTVTVPASLQEGGHDIKVDGQESSLSYSISFKVMK